MMIEFEGSIKYGANPSGQGGIPRWGKQIQSPEAAALLYTQLAQAAERSQSGKGRGFEAATCAHA